MFFIRCFYVDVIRRSGMSAVMTASQSQPARRDDVMCFKDMELRPIRTHGQSAAAAAAAVAVAAVQTGSRQNIKARWWTSLWPTIGGRRIELLTVSAEYR